MRRFTEEAWGKGDLAVVDELVAPDAVPPHGSDVAGPQGYVFRLVDGKSSSTGVRRP